MAFIQAAAIGRTPPPDLKMKSRVSWGVGADCLFLHREEEQVMVGKDSGGVPVSLRL